MATPPGWWDLPLDPITRSGEIQRLVARRMADAGEAERAEMAGVLGTAADAAHRAGAVMASQFAVVGDGVHVAASMTLSVRPASAPPLLQAADDRVGERQAAVDTVTMGPSGVARRKRCLRSLDLGRPEALEVLSVEYSFPVAG
ncbi:MAG TPA: hypothetical protein VKU91_04110, partial [Acidimicrobiales bacterium]|nr:hypothetical protein [Acidimicrobiales bacterium]